MKAASTPMTDVNSPSIVGLGVATIIDLLGPTSTIRRLLELGIPFRFDGCGQIQIQSIEDDATAVSMVGPGSPIPVRQSDVSPFIILKPFKMATISVFSEEATKTTNPNLETPYSPEDLR